MPSATSTFDSPTTRSQPLLDRLNGAWHERALWAFTAVVLFHWGEHLAQTFQIYVLGWNPPAARGVLGLWFPALISSEIMHYLYALVMVVGFWMLRKGFVGLSRTWWMIAFWIQFWHHIEHALLQGQVIVGQNILGSPIPLSVAQLFVPRVELHMFYNTIVTIPMVVSMFYHLFPSPEEEQHMRCSCSLHQKSAVTHSAAHQHA